MGLERVQIAMARLRAGALPITGLLRLRCLDTLMLASAVGTFMTRLTISAITSPYRCCRRGLSEQRLGFKGEGYFLSDLQRCPFCL
jgi:hypothetical protein